MNQIYQPIQSLHDLLMYTYVQHALLQPDYTDVNTVSTTLATSHYIFGDLREYLKAYSKVNGCLQGWEDSPERISSETEAIQRLGDVRFQQAFANFFAQHSSANIRDLMLHTLFFRPGPLLYGLLLGMGRPLTFLSDGLELGSSVLVVQGLTLCACGWLEPVAELLNHPELVAQDPRVFASPEALLDRVARDERFSAIARPGSGFSRVQHILVSEPAKEALLEYVREFDCRDPRRSLQELAILSVLLFCATHEPGRPAYNVYLGQLPTHINSTRVIFDSILIEHKAYQFALLRVVWLIMIVTYVTQQTPAIKKDLVGHLNTPMDWQIIMGTLRTRHANSDGNSTDYRLLRAVRSMEQLSKAYMPVHGFVYANAAFKLVNEWQRWTLTVSELATR